MNYPVFKFKLFVLATFIIAVLTACNEKAANSSPAPLGENSALEKLADAYNLVSEQLDISPIALNPKGRKKFVTQVFIQAGFDYTLTLIAISKLEPSEINLSHKDMRELLFFPHYQYQLDEVGDIYTDQEFAAINEIYETWK